MQFRSLFNAALALLLAFSCYSFVPAYADETGPLDNGSGVNSDSFSSADGLDEGIGDFYEGSTSDNGSGSVDIRPDASDFSEFKSDLSSDFDSVSSSGGGSVADGEQTSEITVSSRAIPAVVVGAAELLSVAATAVGVIQGIKDIFGSNNVSEGLLTSILSVAKYINDDTSDISTRSLSIYNTLSGTISNRLLNISNYSSNLSKLVNIDSSISGIKNNTDSFKTSLSSIASRLLWSGNLGSGTANYTAAELLGNLNLLAQQQRNSLTSIAGRMIYEGDIGYGSATYTLPELAAQLARTIRSVSYRTGVLSGISSSSLTYSTADLLFHLNNLLYRRTIYEGDIGYGSATYTLPELAAQLARTTRSVSYRTGVLSGISSSSLTYSTADLLFHLNNLLYRRTLYEGDIGYGSKTYSSAELLAYIARNTLDSPSGGGLTDNQFGAILASIDRVSDLLLIAGAKDLVETIVGDFHQIVNPATTGSIESALQSAFPFCIPAIVKQLLGLLEADPVPPSFEFDIGGQPLVLDASRVHGFADLLSWACRFLFLLGLLIATPRFIYKEVAA